MLFVSVPCPSEVCCDENFQYLGACNLSVSKITTHCNCFCLTCFICDGEKCVQNICEKTSWMVDLGKMETYKRIIISAFRGISNDRKNSDLVMTFGVNLWNLLLHNLFYFPSLNSVAL